jgi:hypothetical protein
MNIDLKLLKKQRNHLNNILADDQAIELLSKAQKNALQGIQNLLDALSDEQEDKFPNGLTSWIETHHEIVAAIALNPEDAHNKVNDVEATMGTGGLYELGEKLTDKFEQEHKGKQWGIDDNTQYFDAIEEFLQTEFDNS